MVILTSRPEQTMFPIIEGAGFPIIQRIAPQPCRAFPPSLPIFAGLLVGI